MGDKIMARTIIRRQPLYPLTVLEKDAASISAIPEENHDKGTPFIPNLVKLVAPAHDGLMYSGRGVEVTGD
jgi:hypothetical protein